MSLTSDARIKTAIVHYHARPGGVTRVVERAVESIESGAHCLFFTGEAARGETPLQKKIRVVPNLSYSSEQKIKPLDLMRYARGAFGSDPDIWHIHNHSLGKNPALTQEVTNLAMAGQKILLQIHDFAEDGRPDNYTNLGALKERLYPVASHIHYAALNERDARFLRAAGIPAENLHLLPNAVTSLPIPEKPPISGTAPLYIYPCRAIRRKNIGELLFWSARMPEAKFAITLAPKNPDAKPVYNAWVAFAEELGLNIDFDAGAKQPFHQMIAQADMLITTSIAEGFGLAFLEPWLSGKPLTGRNLPQITADFEKHGLDLSNLYNRLPVPLSGPGWDIRDEFLNALETGMKASYRSYNREWNSAVFEAAQTALIKDSQVDFGILNEPMQRTIIRAIKQNPELLDTVLIPPGSVEQNRRVTEETYNLKNYGTQLLSIYQKLQTVKKSSVRYADGAALLNEFLNPGRFNLLRT